MSEPRGERGPLCDGTCKCCGKVVAPGCLVCTHCAVTDPEGPSLLAAEAEARRA